MPLTQLDNLLKGASGTAHRAVTARPKLSRSVVSHDHLDTMLHGNFVDDSPRFKRVTIEDAPKIPPKIADPDPIDFTTAPPEEIKAWQEEARAAKAARDEAPQYSAWPDLTRDVFYSYHTYDMPEVVNADVDPGVELHKRIMPKAIATDDHAKSRNITRGDATAAVCATMAFVGHLRETLTDELLEQAQETQQIEEEGQIIDDLQGEIDDLREILKQPPGPDGFPGGTGGVPGGPGGVTGRLKELIRAKGAAKLRARNVPQTPMSGEALEAIQQATQAAQEAAEAAGHVPSFGAGFGQGEPTYESPEQALSIAEMWANNPQLRAMAELFGRLDRDIRFQRSKRVIGGNDEIVDVEFGDNLSRVLPAELALFADPDFEDDFLVRYASQELLVFSTVGEEHAGRGPIIIVLDGSGSMSGERNIWARAISMCLLHIARLEKRDFACIEFSGGSQYAEWHFPAKASLDPEKIVEMASHFFSGGTAPIVGVAGAAKLMKDSPVFKKADLVMVGDGNAGFSDEDKRLRDELNALGVRIFGIGIGGPFDYLEHYCEHVVDVHDFDLTDPSQATAELATHVT